MINGTLASQQYPKYLNEARIYFEHLRIFKLGLLFKDNVFKYQYKGSYEICFIQHVFYNIFKSTDGGFEWLSKFCDQMRARAVTKEKQDDPIVNDTKNLELANQIAVLKRALCKREATIKIEPELLTPIEYKFPTWVDEEIPSTFIKLEIQKNYEFSSTKSCILCSAQCGGSFAILRNDLLANPICENFMTHYIGDYQVNPTIQLIIKKTPEIKKELTKMCFDLTKHYHVCDSPQTCEEWDKHPPCLITQVSFRGGKVRPLTMFLPEINYLGSLMKNTFKKILTETVTNDLFVASKYYYEHILSKYHSGDWMHSGDLRSCTNLMDPRVSKELLWRVWKYCTGNENPKYRRILDLCFSYYRLVEKDLALIHIRERTPVEQKREHFNIWLKNAPYLKQMRGQHMGMSLSFWLMGTMHALTDSRVYHTPFPKISATDRWRMQYGGAISKSKVGNVVSKNGKDKLVTLERDKISSGEPTLPGSVTSFGDDVLQVTPLLRNIKFYEESIETFNQEWSTKGNFITKEGCVFTERVFSRVGDRLVPLIHIKSKLLFRELKDKRPYMLESIKNLSDSVDQEFNNKFLNRNGIYLYKKLDLAKRIMFLPFKKRIKSSHIPLHVSPKYGGLGMPGVWTKKDYRWMIGLYQLSKEPEFLKTWKALKRDTGPVLEKVKRTYPSMTKVHEGKNMYEKEMLREAIGHLTSLSENLLNVRTKVERHINVDEYADAYHRLYNKMKLKLLDRDFSFSLNRLDFNLTPSKLIGIDDDLDLLLNYKNKTDIIKLTANYRLSDKFELRKILGLGKQYLSLRDVYNFLLYYYRDIPVLETIQKEVPEKFPFEYKAMMKSALRFEPLWPITYLVAGIMDSGKRKGIEPHYVKFRDHSFNYYTHNKKVIAYKTIITPFEKLSIRQINHLKAIIYGSTKPSEVLDYVLDGSIIMPDVKVDLRTQFNEKWDLHIPRHREKLGKKYHFLPHSDYYLAVGTNWKLIPRSHIKLFLGIMYICTVTNTPKKGFAAYDFYITFSDRRLEKKFEREFDFDFSDDIGMYLAFCYLNSGADEATLILKSYKYNNNLSPTLTMWANFFRPMWPKINYLYLCYWQRLDFPALRTLCIDCEFLAAERTWLNTRKTGLSKNKKIIFLKDPDYGNYNNCKDEIWRNTFLLNMEIWVKSL